MGEERIKCPFCDTYATGIHRLVRHIRGCPILSRAIGDVSLNKADLAQKRLDHLQQKVVNPELKAALSELLFSETQPLEDNRHEETSSYQVASFDLKDYFAENPVCREERQYAHWLACCLQNSESEMQKQICNIIGQVDRIVQTHFEVSMMRDLWNACSRHERIMFNNKLLRYCKREELDKNYDKHPNFWDSPPLMRWMMNAKPDIALLVQKQGEFWLYFIECKYKSKEDVYVERSTDQKFEKTQCDVQKAILNFLCGDDEASGLGIKFEGNKIKPGNDIIKVQFVDENERNQLGNYNQAGDCVQIPIRKLMIELGLGIAGGGLKN